MAFIPVQDVVMAELYQTLHGQNIENTLYFRLQGGVGVGEVIDLWNQLLLWWNSSFALELSGDLALRGGKITDLTSANSFAVEFSAPTPFPTGDDPSPAMPGNVSLSVSFKTLNRGRSFRGRNYVAGIPENQVTGNTIGVDIVNGMLTAYTALRVLPTTAPWKWVVVSRYTNNAPRVAGVATDITGVAVVDPYVDSQRRRLTGRGN